MSYKLYTPKEINKKKYLTNLLNLLYKEHLKTTDTEFATTHIFKIDLGLKGKHKKTVIISYIINKNKKATKKLQIYSRHKDNISEAVSLLEKKMNWELIEYPKEEF